MEISNEVSGRHLVSVPDRRVLWLGAASLIVASLSYAFVWLGGLWAVPVWSALAIATWRRAWRRRMTGWVRAGVALTAVAVLIGAYAIASSGGIQPALRTESKAYLPGNEVGVRLKAGIQGVGYNLCFAFATLERLDGDGWRPLEANLGPHDSVLVACTSELRLLPSLFGAQGTVYLPDGLRSGEYRLIYQPAVGGEQRRVATGPFTVMSAAP